jgi:hypothetical protein
MTTGFTTRSREIQELVLAYFRSCGNEAKVLPVQDIPSAVEIVLRGGLATRFETVSVPEQGQPGVRRLRLLFDRNLAAIAPGYELVAPRSHVLRLIQNSLAARATFTRSAAHFNLDGTFSDLEALGITVRHATLKASCRYVCRQFYAVRYTLRQSAYERIEDTLLVVVDPSQGVTLSVAEAAALAQVNLVDFDRATYRNQISDWKPARREDLLGVFQLAEVAAKERVADLLRDRAVKMRDQFQQEYERVRQHFQTELENASPARRQELKQALDQQIQELQQRYKLCSELVLLSLQEIVIPTVEYTLTVADGDGSTHLAQSFVYDPLSNVVKTKPCDRCKQHREWAYCARGKHLDCGACGTVKKCSHSDCDHAACEVHAVHCNACMKIVCALHERSCSYCKTRWRYCTEHIIRSFEDRDICPQCARFCGDCGKAFPPQRSTTCVVCSRDFCDGHSRVCPSCGRHYCQEHGAKPRYRADVYCRRCLASCSYCSRETLYLRADLQYCAECGSALCRDHLNNCVSCGKLLCASHVLLTRQGKGCATCFAPCRTCQTVTHRSALVRCHVCPQSDEGLHCSDHTNTCEICKKPTCDNHMYTLVDRRRACSGCSDVCAACTGRFARDQLTKCPQCSSPFCSKDVIRSQFRDESYCKRHAAYFVTCGGCNRNGPRQQLQKCHLCEMTYCPHCINGDGNNLCTCCRNLRPLQNTSELVSWCQVLSAASIPGLIDSQKAEILHAIMGKDSAFEFTTSECHTYLILRAYWKPGFLNYFRKWFRDVTGFVAVRDKRSWKLVHLRINP